MASVHVIIGEDDYLVAETAKKSMPTDWELEVIDSATSGNEETRLADLARVRESFFTDSLFGGGNKVTWWKNVKFLPSSAKGEDKASAEVKETLEKFADKIAGAAAAEGRKLVITGPRLLKTSVFAKKLASVAEIVIFAALKPWEQVREAAARTAELAKAEGIVFAPNALESFVARVGTDTRSIVSELAKLRTYLGGEKRKVTTDDIDAITSQGVGVEPEFWGVTDGIGERNAEKAVAAARQFEGENGFAVLMTSVIEKFLRGLVELKAADEEGRLSEATKGMAPFVAKKNSAFLSKWRLNELRVARSRIMDLREKCVSTAGSADVLVLTEIVRICGGRRTR